MYKKLRTTVRLKHSDVYRALLSDTTPYEVPIIFSNDGFYKNLVNFDSKSQCLKELIYALVYKDRKHTVPHRYNIVKDADSIRTLSLIHPYSQVKIATFYAKYSHLICLYARSPYSIRRPEKVGTSFFIKDAENDQNKYKGSTIDTIGIENITQNPASYFTYYGFGYLYRFFLSDDHTRLEKKYKYRLLLDVSKCFDSIYTHSIAWAVKNKRIAKKYKPASTFGNNFDKLMQQMNHSETSGICIGPETSRIFAEIILSKVDQLVFKKLDKRKISFRSEYECRRYVDNYYIFANSEKNLMAVQHEISIVLLEFKLHLNLSKSEKLTRPFYSQKSLVIDKVNERIKQLWRETFESKKHNEDYFQIPRRICRYRSLFRNFTRNVKSACYSCDVGYDAMSNYLVGAMKRKLIELCNNFGKLSTISNLSEDIEINIVHYRQLMLFILEVGFYFFTLHPTVASSFRLSYAMVIVAQHMRNHDEEGLGILREHTLQWTTSIANSPTLVPLFEKRSVVPIEFLNILVALQEFSTDGSVESELLKKVGLDDASNDRYFDIIVKLFIYRDNPNFSEQRKTIFIAARNKLLIESCTIKEDTELVCLLLDILSCPFIPIRKRKSLLLEVWKTLKKDSNLSNLTNKQAKKLVEELENQHWFVWWQGVDLRNILEKKELSPVYS